MAAKLLTANVPGNLHQAAQYITNCQLAEYVLAMHYNSGNYTLVVLRVPAYYNVALEALLKKAGF